MTSSSSRRRTRKQPSGSRPTPTRPSLVRPPLVLAHLSTPKLTFFCASPLLAAKDFVGATKLYSDAITLNPRDPIFVSACNGLSALVSNFALTPLLSFAAVVKSSHVQDEARGVWRCHL